MEIVTAPRLISVGRFPAISRAISHYYFSIFILLIIPIQMLAAGEKIEPLKVEWKQDTKILQYKQREFVIGVRVASIATHPLIGTRKLHASVYSEDVFPMTLQTRESYVLYDQTQKKYIVYNIATCLKGKDSANSEKTDWVGVLKPSADHWEGDILVLRKYEKKGPLMRVPYYSMGRSFPTYVKEDGSCTVQYTYLGNITLDLVSREIPDELLKRIIDEFDSSFYEHKDNE